MAILIANIGTSDIAVKIEEIERYIPVGFDRNEPNIDYSDLTEKDKSTWEQELDKSFIREYLSLELGIDRYSFRELTKRILEEYNKDQEKWHHRISLDRFKGVIDRAKSSFKIEKVYLFVTNQLEYIPDPKTGKPKFNKGYPTDTIHLYEIFQKWFKHEMPNLTLEKKEIPQNILPIQQDKLFGYYYQFFRENTKSNSIILVSIKGGTPQMQSALRLQAIASSAKKQLFVEPILSVKRILYGEPSECNFTSYWQYMRSQKYEDVKTILENSWDFYGAIQLLEQWKDALNFFNSNIKDVKISDLEKLIDQVINALKIANYCFNLDWETAKKDILDNNSTKISLNIINQVKDNYNSLLNLYTQCRIYEKLNQMSNLLVGVTSFYEIVLEKIADKLGKNNDEYPEKKARHKKLEFVKNEIKKHPNKYKYWTAVENNLKSLNYWCDKRNKFIHNGKGISKESMEKLYSQRNSYYYREYYEREDAQNACGHDKILDVMTDIIKSDLEFISLEQKSKFVGQDKPYYIYSEVRDWVIKKLMDKGLQ